MKLAPAIDFVVFSLPLWHGLNNLTITSMPTSCSIGVIMAIGVNRGTSGWCRSLVIVMGLVSCSVRGQSAMPLNDGRWIVAWGTSDCLNFGQGTPDLRYDMGADTTIGVNTYKRLIRSGVCDQCCPPVALPGNGYLGALRDDGDGRVWYIPADSSSEMVFLDFTLEVGDTVTGYLPTIASGNWPYPVVVAVDSVLLNDGEYHQRIRLDGPHEPPPDLIRGVGPTTGLLEAFRPNMEVSASLLCALTGSQVLYSDGFSDCDQHVAIEQTVHAGPDVHLGLDATGRWTVRSDERDEPNIVGVSVFDAIGRELWGASSIKPLSLVLLPSRQALPHFCIAVVRLSSDGRDSAKTLPLLNL